jgi:phytoene dehydrogenase-like protein
MDSPTRLLRSKQSRYDAIVIGAGPNGLAAALILARAGLEVLVVEARATIGGGTRTAELTLPGFHHDVCSTAHPLGVASPLLSALPLADHGVEWIQPPLPLAHPLDDGPFVALSRSVEETAARLGRDGAAYRRLVGPLVERWPQVVADVLAPLGLPQRPLDFARLALPGLLPAAGGGRLLFSTKEARALVAGMAGHAILPLERSPSMAIALLLTMLAHAVGWPIARGGSQAIADALAALLTKSGGEIITDWQVESIDELPPARAVLFDTSARALLAIARTRLPPAYQRRLSGIRYGPGVFKIDWALSGPVPWRDPIAAQTATLHLGGRAAEVAAAEREVWAGRHPEAPFVLFAQPSLFDGGRAPAGSQTAWAYCHVPRGSTVEMTARIEAQVERFAPGFGELILARHTKNALEMQAWNANYVGGDINSGVQDLWQHFARPVLSTAPYRTAAAGIYLCSSATPPGGGVHGMCGYHAARTVLADMGLPMPSLGPASGLATQARIPSV